MGRVTHAPFGPLVGILVGGAATRMGGIAKGLLGAPDGSPTLVERLAHVARASHDGSQIILVGSTTAYDHLGFQRINDQPAGVGPLGALLALLECALVQHRQNILTLACDLPFITPSIVSRVLSYAPQAAALAARSDGIWQTQCARYASEPVFAVARSALIAGERSLQCIFERLGALARELPLSEAEQAALADWDAPEDIVSRSDL